MLRYQSKIGCGWIGLILVGMVGNAAGHSGVDFLAPGNDFVVKWYQPHGETPVEYWDIEITPLEGLPQTYIREARVFADESCWGVDVPVDRRAKVRIRGVANNRVSDWSRYTVVPEPAFALTSLISAAALCMLGRRRHVSRVSRTRRLS